MFFLFIFVRVVMQTSILICLIFQNFVIVFFHIPALGRPLLVAGLLHCFLHCFLIIVWLVIGIHSIKRQIGKAFGAHVFATRFFFTLKSFTYKHKLMSALSSFLAVSGKKVGAHCEVSAHIGGKTYHLDCLH